MASRQNDKRLKITSPATNYQKDSAKLLVAIITSCQIICVSKWLNAEMTDEKVIKYKIPKYKKEMLKLLSSSLQLRSGMLLNGLFEVK